MRWRAAADDQFRRLLKLAHSKFLFLFQHRINMDEYSPNRAEELLDEVSCAT
jgi:hypothetical protein